MEMETQTSPRSPALRGAIPIFLLLVVYKFKEHDLDLFAAVIPPIAECFFRNSSRRNSGSSMTFLPRGSSPPAYPLMVSHLAPHYGSD